VRQHRDATGYGSTVDRRRPGVLRSGEDKVAVEIETIRKQHSCLRRQIMAHRNLQRQVARGSAISCRAERREQRAESRAAPEEEEKGDFPRDLFVKLKKYRGSMVN
jgi:hypothetical protein